MLSWFVAGPEKEVDIHTFIYSHIVEAKKAYPPWVLHNKKKFSKEKKYSSTNNNNKAKLDYKESQYQKRKYNLWASSFWYILDGSMKVWYNERRPRLAPRTSSGKRDSMKLLPKVEASSASLIGSGVAT